MKTHSVKKIVTVISLAFTSSLFTSSAFAQSEDMQTKNVFELNPTEKVETTQVQNQFTMESLNPRRERAIELKNEVNNVNSITSTTVQTTERMQRTNVNADINNSVNNINSVRHDNSIVRNSVETGRLTTGTMTTGTLTSVGEKAGNLEPLKGFARDLPLLDVLKQITPNGWKVKKMAKSELNVKKTISWTGGKSWVDTLEIIAKTNGLNVIVMWDKKEIIVGDSQVVDSTRVLSNNVRNTNNSNSSASTTVTKAETVTTTMPTNVPQSKTVTTTTTATTLTNRPRREEKGIFELESDNAVQIATGNSQAKPVEVEKVMPVVKVAALPPVVAPMPSTWTLEPSKTLKENIIEFGRSVGYKVVWNGEDYPVDEIRPLNGLFESDTGPIRQLSLDYGPESRVQQPLAFQFFQNKTLVVENWKFEQSGYPQYNRE